MLDKFAIPLILILGILSFLQLGSGDPNALSGSSDSGSLFVSFGNETLSQPGSLDDDRELTDREIAQQIQYLEARVERLSEDVNASVYKPKVSLSAGTARALRSRDEYIVIQFGSLDGLISISDWALESSRTGGRYFLGPADTVPNRTFRESDVIAVTSRDRVYVHTGKSPIGVSFRTNICTGYFNESADFEPPLPRECPQLIDEIPDELVYGRNALQNSCIRSIQNIGRCQEPESDDFDPLSSRDCKRAVQDFDSYADCVRVHQNDFNFAGNEWHIYLDRDSSIWPPERDVITLYDSIGKVVDVVKY